MVLEWVVELVGGSSGMWADVPPRPVLFTSCGFSQKMWSVQALKFQSPGRDKDRDVEQPRLHGRQHPLTTVTCSQQ